MRETSENQPTWSLAGSVAAALASAVCCTFPLILVSLGIGGAWLSRLAVLEPYRPLFIVLSLGLLGFAFYEGYRRLKAPDCARKSKMRAMYVLPVAGLTVLGLIISPWLFASMSSASKKEAGAGATLDHVVLEVESMTCASCDIRIRMALGRLDGVADARASLNPPRVAVQYDPAQTSIQAIVKTVEEAGYPARLAPDDGSGLADFSVAETSGPAMETVEAEALRTAFNEAKEEVRLIAVLSPTCPGCVRGHEVVRKIFEQHDTVRLKGFIVWLPMLAGDDAAAAGEQAQAFEEARIALQGWDAEREIGTLFEQTLNLRGTAWDVYLVYESGVAWEGETPPEPTFWMHQLAPASGADQARSLCLNPTALSTQVGKMLNQID